MRREFPLLSVAARRINLVGMLLSMLCLAYFYVLDRVVFSTAHFTPIFRFLLTVYDMQAAWLLLAVCFLAAIWNRPKPLLQLIDFIARHHWGLILGSAAFTAAGTMIIYHNHPLSMDEYSAVFQSKVFASGHLFAQLPPSMVDWLVVPVFNGSFFFASPETGRVIEGYWPGFALLLAPFQFFNVAWLCNALLAGLAIYLIHRITLEITADRRAAAWAMLFTVASGVFWADAISYYSMQAHLTANLLFVALLLKPTGSRAFSAGLVGSLALVLHNPFPHALFAAPWIVAMAINRDQRRYLFPLTLGYLPLGLGVGLGWLMLRSDIVPVLHDASPVSGVLRGIFTWPDAVLLDMRVAALAKMWVWAMPCLFVFALLGRLRCGENRHVRLLTQSALLTFIGYLFVKLDQGHGWGYRYFHSAWGAIPILAGCAMTGRSETPETHMRLVSFAGAAAVLGLLVLTPFQMSQIEGIIWRDLIQVPAARRPGNNVYFVQPWAGFYLSDLIQIDPLLREPDLMLASRGSSLDAELLRQNWPNAVKLGGRPGVEQWTLGPVDQRVSIPGSTDAKHFEIRFRGPDQSANH
jgi:hypothetical protein